LKATSALDLHPHEFQGSVPDRLPAEVIRELSVLKPGKAIAAIVVEWLGIITAIALCEAMWNPVLYVFVVIWIGARQHALTVLGHDAAHFRLLPDRRWNDWVGNVAVMWPVFLAADGYRHYHGEHHRFTNTAQDGNRTIWKTHTAGGKLTAEWTFPKTRIGLFLTILRRAAFLTGLFWILRGLVAAVILRRSWGGLIARMSYYAIIAGTMAATGHMRGFLLYWIVPYCTAHIAFQYIRLICEHSAIHSDDPSYAATRTTLARLWERWLIVPRNIHYHIEHHWYPSVPFYNLPTLHERLMAQPGFRRQAVVTPSLVASLKQCIVRQV
jgi:fatty acid desaturase